MHMRVAPHAGAWIETKRRSNKNRLFVVAPHAGAWIETTPNIALLMDDMASRPTRARGLKHNVGGTTQYIYRSRPTRARGLKLMIMRAEDRFFSRRAPRGRVD